MSRYTSATDGDRAAMLAAIGAESVDDLFADVPEGVRLGRPLDLPAGKPEQEVYAALRDLAARNVSAEDELTFLGAGMYDHYVPALVDAIISRSEFLTPYTPYQPEISQGGLQVMFEYQTAISELTGLPVSNASVYEGPSALAAAGYLARLHHPERTRFLVSRGVHPHSRETLATTSVGWGTTIEELPLAGGATDADALAERARRRRLGRLPAVPELPRRGGGPRGARAGGQGGGRAGHRAVRPDPARHPAPARRLRRRRRRGGGPVARQPARLRRSQLRLLRRPGRVRPPHARPDRGRDDRRRRPPRLRAHAPDARAAHPPRARDAQHLHGAGAERARRDDPPELARPRGPGRARRAAAPAHRLRARGADGDRGRRAHARAAGRARVRRDARRGRRRGDRALRRPGGQPRLCARARLPRARQRPARGRHRAAQPRGHRPLAQTIEAAVRELVHA